MTVEFTDAVIVEAVKIIIMTMHTVMLVMSELMVAMGPMLKIMDAGRERFENSVESQI